MLEEIYHITVSRPSRSLNAANYLNIGLIKVLARQLASLLSRRNFDGFCCKVTGSHGILDTNKVKWTW